MLDRILRVSTAVTGYLVSTISQFRFRRLIMLYTGGRLLNNDTIVNIGLQLVDGCWNTYAGTTYELNRLSLMLYWRPLRTGIGPEAFAYTSSDGFFTGSSTPPTPGQLVFNKERGFYITSSAYVLRPEVLESNFYAWRVTGDTKYLDRAAMAIKSFNQFLSVNGAFAGLYNVDSKNSERIDDMESFWFAEVLKYLWAISFIELGPTFSPLFSSIVDIWPSMTLLISA